MSVYTISPDLLRNIKKEEGVYFTDILFVFAQKNNHLKITKDKDGHVLDAYRTIGPNGDTIKMWLDLMSCFPSSFEIIDVDLSEINCEETRFVKLCKETKGHNKIIYYSLQHIKKFDCKEDLIQFEDTAINVLDRDSARIEIEQSQRTGNTYITNSQYAQGNSKINKSNNK